LAIGAIAAPIAYIIMSGKQNELTREAVNKSDDANSLTRGNIIHNREYEAIKFLRDSLDRIRAQQQADRSYSLAKQSTDSSYNIAKRTLEIGMGISQTDLRPFVWYDNKMKNEIPAIGNYSPVFYIKNFGKSPAYNIVINAYITKNESFYLKNLVFDPINSEKGAPILPPGVDNFVSSEPRPNIKPFFIDDGLFIKINNGTNFLFVAMQISYEQYIGDSIVDYTTTFCLFYNPGSQEYWYYPRLNSDTCYKKSHKK
jgi:hypothetical protein